MFTPFHRTCRFKILSHFVFVVVFACYTPKVSYGFISELCVRRNIRSAMPRKQDGKTGRVTCHIKIKLLDRSKLLEETKNSGWKKHRCNFCGKGFNTKMLVDRHTYVCAKTRRTRTGLRKQKY